MEVLFGSKELRQKAEIELLKIRIDVLKSLVNKGVGARGWSFESALSRLNLEYERLNNLLNSKKGS